MRGSLIGTLTSVSVSFEWMGRKKLGFAIGKLGVKHVGIGNFVKIILPPFQNISRFSILHTD